MSFLCSSLFAFLASSIIQSISVSTMCSVVMASGSILSWLWSGCCCMGESPDEPTLCLFRITFRRPLPNTPLFFCGWSIVVGVLPVVFLESGCCCVDFWSLEPLTDSGYLQNSMDLVNPPFGPRGPVPLLLGSWIYSNGFTFVFLM